MKPKRPTSQHVAKRAGVSRTTVSFVLNNAPLSDSISEETRERVLAAARELGYVPDAAARTLASGRSRTLGLILPEAHHLEVDAYIPRLLFSLTELSNAHGFRMLVEFLRNGERNGYRALVNAKHIDGLLVLNPRTDDEYLTELISSGFPIVLLGSVDSPAEYSVRQTPAAEIAVQHLVELGHECIGHITYGPPVFREVDARLTQYREVLEAAGLPLRDAWLRYANFSAESGYQVAQSLLDEKQLPTALFVGNDTVALGVMAAVHQRGLRIPEDIAVVGYDDIPTAAYAAPPLTTVRTSPHTQGQLGGEMLIKLVQGEPVSERRLATTPEFIVRASCGAR